MRKNVYTKSILRKPLHSLILAFLLFAATFGFVLRAVEFLTVRDQIFSIATYYQSIGFLSSSHELDDVGIGADFLENSPYIEFVDRRRTVEGFLQDLLNSAVADPHGNLLTLRRMGHPIPEAHDAFFYGELIDKIERVSGGWHLILSVDDVLVGYPEHVVAGQSDLRVNFDLEVGHEFAIDGLEIGERYFLRGVLEMPMVTDGSWIPTVGDSTRNMLLMQPLSPDGLWYIHVPHGETVDFTLSGLDDVLEEIESVRRNHHSVQLKTTKDMTLMPIMLDTSEMGFMVEGRPIDHEDYLNANPVAAIHYQFAQLRGLGIGDIITVKVPRAHHVEYDQAWINSVGAIIQSFSAAHVESVPQDEEMHEIELEIVGIYNLFRRLEGDPNTSFSTHIYIPDSILPNDLVIISDRWGNPDSEIYLPSTWYSFMLSCSRDELAFMAENRQPLADAGLTLTIISSAQHFWDSADVILQSIWFNGIVFCIVLVLVVALVVFLFLRQRRKEFTVSRMLGYSSRRSVGEVLATATLFLIPIAMGSVFAWLFARQTIVNTLQSFEELDTGYEAVFSLSPFWLIGLTSLVFILAMLILLIGAIRMTRRPVLELLHRRG